MISFYLNSFKGLSRPVWYMSFVMLINRSGMMVLPFMALYLTKELGWSKLDTGIATSCFGLGSICGSFLGGWLSDRIGTLPVMIWSLILGGAGFFLFLFTTDFYLLCLIIFGVSTIADAFRPAIFTAIQDFSSSDNLTRGISLIRMAINLGISIGPAVGGFLAAAYGYDWLFIIDGVTCILAGLLLIYIFGSKGKSPQFEKTESITITDTKISPYTDVKFMLFMFFNLIGLIAFFQILYSIPVYFEEVFSVTERDIGWFFTANGLLIFFFEMPIIYVLEKRGVAFRPMILGSFLIMLSFLGLFYFETALLAIVFFTLLVSLGEIINFPFISTVAIKRAPDSHKGKYMGATTVMFSLAFLLAPLTGLPIIELIGYDPYWLLASAVILISIIGFRWLKKDLEINQN